MHVQHAFELTTSQLPVTHPLLELCVNTLVHLLTDAIMAQITKRHQGHSMTRGRFDEGHEDAV